MKHPQTPDWLAEQALIEVSRWQREASQQANQNKVLIK